MEKYFNISVIAHDFFFYKWSQLKEEASDETQSWCSSFGAHSTFIGTVFGRPLVF